MQCTRPAKVLRRDKSTIQPPAEAVTCDELERLVEDCRRTANDLKEQIHEKLLEESHTASQSVNTAFKGIEQMQEALSDGGAYAHKEDFRPEAGHLGFLLKDATGQWSQMDDAVGTASQEIKEFQHTKLHDVLAELEAAEGKIAAEVDGTILKQKEAKDHLQSLCEQIGGHQKEHKNALNQRHDAWARTVGFSVVGLQRHAEHLDPELIIAGLRRRPVRFYSSCSVSYLLSLTPD